MRWTTVLGLAALAAVAACGGSAPSSGAGGGTDTTTVTDTTTDPGTTTDTATDTFWDAPYNAACNGARSHNAGLDCLSCHNGSKQFKLAFGGTVYAGAAGAANTEVGIRSGATFVKVCTSTNGNFYKQTASINWATAEIRVRNAGGEGIMGSAGTGACNSCHNGSTTDKLY